MSFIVKTFSSKRPVWLAYALQNCNVHAYSLYQESPDGSLTKLSADEHLFEKRHFLQGTEDIIGNNSVVHSQLTGVMEVLPVSPLSKFSRSVSTTPTDSRLKEFRCEYISTSGTSGEGSSHFIMDQPGNFFQSRLHYSFDRDWSFLTVVQSIKYYPDHYRTTPNLTQVFNVEFPELKRSDIKYQTLQKYYYSDIKASAITRSEAGVITSTVQASLGFVSLGILAEPDLTGIVNLLTIPVTGAPVEPSDLLIRLTKKIGSLCVNNIANIAQLRKLDELIPPSIKNHYKLFKTAAEFILWYKYSYSTTDMDIEAMLGYYLRAEDTNFKVNKGYSHRTTVNVTVDDYTTDRFTFYLGSYQQSIFQKFGLQLNLANTWDLIPFSFVVDWFTKIGDMLASLDAYDEWIQVPLACYTSSRTSLRPYPLPSSITGAVGHLSTKFYCRQVSRTLPMTLVSPSLNLPRGNVLTALSLALANKK